MTIVKTHTGTVITKDGPKVKKLHQTERMAWMQWLCGTLIASTSLQKA